MRMIHVWDVVLYTVKGEKASTLPTDASSEQIEEALQGPSELMFVDDSRIVFGSASATKVSGLNWKVSKIARKPIYGPAVVAIGRRVPLLQGSSLPC